MPPLRWFARRASRQLAAAQTIAVVERGGRSVSLGDLLGHEFAADPLAMFSEDRYHPPPAATPPRRPPCCRRWRPRSTWATTCPRT
ncbi:hypothetical protein ACFQY7_49175 [Actinomadura luteofluorescens]|uniref:hypothetical protein n=1 Tax=Actinomadura luteofluorescens TaxID=46163 RepID=UPI003642AAAF